VNSIDVIILALLAFGVLSGFVQGFVVELASILGAVVGLVVAQLEYAIVRNLLELVLPKSGWVTAISYLIVFLLVWMAIVAIARKVRTVIRLFLLGWADRLGGAVLGLFPGALMVELLLYLGQRVPDAGLHRAIKHSTLAPSFMSIIPYVHQLFPHIRPH
jgi:membrane protein required for colicin V production